jgi:hypothetical protein
MATSAARAKQLIPRPTGLTRDEYRGHEKWSYRRWAWEFLRRNQEFIRACRESRGDPERQAQVATEFGLKRFKPYTEGFTTNKRPMFSAASVDSWSALDAEEVRVVRTMRLRLTPSWRLPNGVSKHFSAGTCKPSEPTSRRRTSASQCTFYAGSGCSIFLTEGSRSTESRATRFAW